MLIAMDYRLKSSEKERLWIPLEGEIKNKITCYGYGISFADSGIRGESG